MRKLGIAATLCSAIAFLGSAGVAWGGDALPAPPYMVTGSNHVYVGVKWDEAALRAALPEGIEPVPEMTGAINIYQNTGGSGIAPYQAAYFWADIEGFDAADGTKGRWMLAGVYGPDEKTSAALKAFHHLPVRNGVSRVETKGDLKHAIGTVGGKDFVTAVIKSSNECQAIGSTVNYTVQNKLTGQILVNVIPYAGDWCGAEPISLEVTASSGDPFSKFIPVEVLWAGEFRNGSFAFTAPVVAP